MAEINFDEFKAVVDYITSNTGKISASLKALIDNTIAVRSDSKLSIITGNTSIKTVNIGSLSLDMSTLNFTGINGIKINSDEFDIISLSKDGAMPTNALLGKTLSSEEVSEIAKLFVSKTSQTSSVKHYYAPSVTVFTDSEIPSMNAFFADFYSVNDIELDKQVVISSRDINDSNNVVSFAIGKTISGAIKGSKKISTKVESINSNIIYSDEERTEVKSIMPSVVIGGSVTIENASSNKSVITSGMLPRYIVKKDLSNIDMFVMQNPTVRNDANIATSGFFDEYLSAKRPVSQNSIDANKEIQNGLDYSFATTSYFNSGSDEEVATITSISAFKSLEAALMSDPAEDGGLGSASGIPEMLSGSNGIARDRAASIRTVYALLSSEIVKRFPGLMMTAADKLSLSSQINLIIQDTDTEFFVRPIILDSAKDGTEIGTFEFFSESVKKKTATERATSSNWNYFA